VKMHSVVFSWLCSEIPKHINSVWNKKNYLSSGKSLIIVPIYKKDDRTDVVIIETYRCYQLHTKFYKISFLDT
jgi:hypothetical protein